MEAESTASLLCGRSSLRCRYAKYELACLAMIEVNHASSPLPSDFTSITFSQQHSGGEEAEAQRWRESWWAISRSGWRMVRTPSSMSHLTSVERYA